MALRNTKFAQKVRFVITDPVVPSSQTLDFEIDGLEILLDKEVFRFKEKDGVLTTQLRYVRPVFVLSNRYLRRASSGTHDIMDVINAVDNPDLEVTIQIVDIATGTDPMPAVRVVSLEDSVKTSISRQFVVSDFGAGFQAKTPLSSIPAWAKMTRNASSYQL